MPRYNLYKSVSTAYLGHDTNQIAALPQIRSFEYFAEHLFASDSRNKDIFYSRYFSPFMTSVMPVARPARPCSSEGMMILVA